MDSLNIMQTKVRVGIIGAGGIAAKLHLPELAAESERAEVRLISGRNQKRLNRLSDLFPVGGTTTAYADIISDAEVDAVIVATPHPQHVVWGKAALQAGKHLFMQKPLCADMAEANDFVEVAEAAASRGQVTLVLPHFSDGLYEVRRQIQEGQAGRIVSANARTAHAGPEVYYREVREIFQEEDSEDLWFFEPGQAAVGALFDMGVYAVAQLVALLGGVRRVSAFTATLDKATTLEDTATLLLEMHSGALAVAETSWCDGARSWRLRAEGTRGRYEIENNVVRHFWPEAFDSDHAEISQAAVVPQQNIGSAHSHWLDCIATGTQPPLSNAHAGRHVTEVLLAALASSAHHQIIDIHTRL